MGAQAHEKGKGTAEKEKGTSSSKMVNLGLSAESYNDSSRFTIASTINNTKATTNKASSSSSSSSSSISTRKNKNNTRSYQKSFATSIVIMTGLFMMMTCLSHQQRRIGTKSSTLSLFYNVQALTQKQSWTYQRNRLSSTTTTTTALASSFLPSRRQLHRGSSQQDSCHPFFDTSTTAGFSSGTTQLFSTSSSSLYEDGSGRRIRQRRGRNEDEGDGFSNNRNQDDDWGEPRSGRPTRNRQIKVSRYDDDVDHNPGGWNNYDKNDDEVGDDDWGSPRSGGRRNRGNRGWNNDDYDNGNGDNDWGSPTRGGKRSANEWSDTNSYNAGGGYDDAGGGDDDDDWGGRPSRREGRSSSSSYGNRGNRGGSLGGGGRGRQRNRNEYGNDWQQPRRGRQQQFRERGPSSSYNRDGGRGSINSNDNTNNNRKQWGRQNDKNPAPTSRPINMNAFDEVDLVHLYGLSSVLNALQASRRDMTTSHERDDDDDDDDDIVDAWNRDEENDDYEDRRYGNSSTNKKKVPTKPEAQLRPYLFVQERKHDKSSQQQQQQSSSTRRGTKVSAAEQVLQMAEERNVPVVSVDKGILNTLSGNRPHQGFVLRCGKLYFEPMSRIPKTGTSNEVYPSVWLVLDEVVDPQNLGALLRSAYFLGGGGGKKRLGVMVCAKNSAPPSSIVSAASAGALELLTIYSTNNLPRTLNHAREDGFRIIGASSSIPNNKKPSNVDDNEDDDDIDDDGNVVPTLYDLQDLPTLSSNGEDDRPIILVLGSEGHGLRTLVAKACTEFVRIPEGKIQDDEDDDDDDDDTNNSVAGVDSLNVSVTGGILLWHLLNGKI